MAAVKVHLRRPWDHVLIAMGEPPRPEGTPRAIIGMAASRAPDSTPSPAGGSLAQGEQGAMAKTYESRIDYECERVGQHVEIDINLAYADSGQAPTWTA
jgi:hypothetical protein